MLPASLTILPAASTAPPAALPAALTALPAASTAPPTASPAFSCTSLQEETLTIIAKAATPNINFFIIDYLFLIN